MDSGTKDLPGISSISGLFRGRLARKEVALGEEVGSGSGGDSGESRCRRRSCGPVSKEEEAGEEG